MMLSGVVKEDYGGCFGGSFLSSHQDITPKLRIVVNERLNYDAQVGVEEGHCN